MFEIWLSMIPSSLLNQNFSVLKALFADYNEENNGTESERASAMGRLGMAVGVAFMVGPVLGTTLLKNYSQAILGAIFMTLLSSLFIFLLPQPKIKSNIKQIKTNRSLIPSIFSIFSIPAAKTRGAQLLFFMRMFMALGFSIFMTVWTVSVKSRFNFGPQDHAYFMGYHKLYLIYR